MKLDILANLCNFIINNWFSKIFCEGDPFYAICINKLLENLCFLEIFLDQKEKLAFKMM